MAMCLSSEAALAKLQQRVNLCGSHDKGISIRLLGNVMKCHWCVNIGYFTMACPIIFIISYGFVDLSVM